jgi:hypothetical protein
MKFEYDMSQDAEYVDIWVQFSVRKRDWEMHLYRHRGTLFISKPMYQYSPSVNEPFEEVERLPKRVQAYFDNALPKAKTLLILESDK